MADEESVADLLDEALETAKKGEAPSEPKQNEPKESDKDKRDDKDRSRSRSRRSRSRDRFGRIKRDRSRSRDRGGRSRDRRDKDRRRSRHRRSRHRGRRRRSSSRGRRRGRDRDREKERRGKKEGSSSSSPSRRGAVQRSAISPESMPKLAEPPVSPASKDPLAPGAPPEEGEKKKKSKWDEVGDPSSLPDWLKDLKDDTGRPTPPGGIDPLRFKIIRMEGVQIRALIGKGGETIKDIRLRSGADIKIDHLPSDPEGNVTIVGDVERTEVMIKEALATKGCPLVPKPQVPPPPPPDGMLSAPPRPLEANENEVIVPGDIVGHLIGPSGANIKEIREKAGGQVFISILPPSTPGADQIVRVAGDSREYARQLILEKIEDLKVQYRPGGFVPGYPGGMTMPMGAAPMPGRSKAVGMVPPQPMPVLPPASLPVPSMPLRPAPPAQSGMPYGMAPASACCGWQGGPEMDPRPSLGGCGLPSMGSTTGPGCMGGPTAGYMGGCGMSGGLTAPIAPGPMTPMAPPCGMGPPGAMGMGMGAPGPPGGFRGPGPPGPPGPPGMGMGCMGLGPPAPAPQANFPPPAPPCMAPPAAPPAPPMAALPAPVPAPAAPAAPALGMAGLASIGPPIPAQAEPPGQESDKQDFNAMLREAAKAAEATIGMSNLPKPSTPSAGVPLL